MTHRGSIVLAVALLLMGGTCAQQASAEDKDKDKDPFAVLMVGPAGERSFTEHAFSRGPSASLEFGVIKDWLEIEIGGARMFRRGHSEWETEVVFKKPFELNETTEFMVGLGPVWTFTKGEGTKLGTTFMAEAMFWASPEKKWGLFLEPSYSIVKGEKSFAVSTGLMFGFH